MTDVRPTRVDLERITTGVILTLVATAIFVSSWDYLTNGLAPYGDDNSAHLALMNHVAELWRSGTFDLWWDQSNLGLPLFLAYQPLPALVGGTLSSLFADLGQRLIVFKGSIVLLWALMPTAWYVGGRWMGLSRGEALVAGLLTLAVRDIHDVGFGFTSATYGGLYTQTWGMFFLPVTVGAFRRYVVDEGLPLVAPVAMFVVVSLSHLWCGMFAGIATATWLVASVDNRGAKFGRAVRIYVPALLLLGFWLGPMIVTDHLIGGLPWKNEYYDGWPVAELFRHLMGGDVFDHGRLPWLSLLAIIGLVLAAQRRERLVERWILVTTVVSVVFFMGRTNFGALYDLIPMHAHINVMRYINAVQFCGVLAAAIAIWRLVGGAWSSIYTWRSGGERLSAVGRDAGAPGVGDDGAAEDDVDAEKRSLTASAEGCDLQNGVRDGSDVAVDENRPQTASAEGCDPRKGVEDGFSGQKMLVLGLAVGALVSGVYIVERAGAFADTLRTFNQRETSFQNLVSYLQPPSTPERIPSRIVASEPLNTDAHVYRDLLPSLSGRGQVQSYALGYHATLSTYYADYTRYDARWARLFGAEYFISRDPHRDTMLGDFDRVFTSGRYTVWRPRGLERAGYFDFITTPSAVHGDLRAIRPAVRRLLVAGFDARALPVLVGASEVSRDAQTPVLVTDSGARIPWNDNPDAWIDALQKVAPSAIDSRVVNSRRGPNWYEADVEASGAERLLLKTNYFPFWHASVDGTRLDVAHVAPNFMAVSVPEGEHTVRFTYRNPWWQKLGALLCVLILLAWAVGGGRGSRHE